MEWQISVLNSKQLKTNLENLPVVGKFKDKKLYLNCTVFTVQFADHEWQSLQWKKNSVTMNQGFGIKTMQTTDGGGGRFVTLGKPVFLKCGWKFVIWNYMNFQKNLKYFCMLLKILNRIFTFFS